jgi:hypothetical protein
VLSRKIRDIRIRIVRDDIRVVIVRDVKGV